MFRYLALLWNPESATISASAAQLRQRIERLSPSWVIVFRGTGVTILMADRSRQLDVQRLAGDSGVVLGEIFPNPDPAHEGPVRHARFGERETRAVLDSEGRYLVSRYWGNYVAFLVGDHNELYLLKDPCGSLPCHLTDCDGVRLVFACLGDIRELGLRQTVNWAAVRARIANGSREIHDCSLVGVSTVYRGECIHFDRDATVTARTCYWRPDFSGTADLVEPEVAQRALRATVASCVQTLAAPHASMLAQVSGGLDSSIVLGSLSSMPSGPEITCYTYFVPQSVCDERRWARYAVQRAGFRHLEMPLATEKLIYKDLPRLRASVEPESYFTRWQKGPIERDLAMRFSASATFTGEGGDAAFCSTSYVFAVDHCLRREGLSFRTIKIAARVAIRRDRTVWNILGKALSRQASGSDADDGKRTLEPFSRLVSSELRESTQVDLERLLRMGSLAFAPSFYDVSMSHHEQAPYVVSPLCTQPVVELCGRIPVDVHFEGGRIRGLARGAFADWLPEPILRRQWKDRPLLQLAQVIAANLPFIREHLLEGALVRERILDRTAVEQALRHEVSSSGAVGSEILSHLDAELWLRDSA
jgi:asparagine synthase (glutamine-hydrolysing)